MGIVLQSWERRGWRAPVRQQYWIWRDRKGVAGNLITPVLNLFFVYGVVTWAVAALTGHRWILGAQHPALRLLFSATFFLSAFQMGVRTLCSGRIYGWRFAMGVPVRALLGNWLNCAATARALALYGQARLYRRSLVWVKTDHSYPYSATRSGETCLLGQILIGSRLATQLDIEEAIVRKAPADRLGEYLVRRGKLSETNLYLALSLQQNLPFSDDLQAFPAAGQALPAEIARRWQVLPFRIAAGQLLIAGPEIPTAEMTQDLQRHTSLELRYHLITPTRYQQLAHEQNTATLVTVRYPIR